jgi:hypothetical protein
MCIFCIYIDNLSSKYLPTPKNPESQINSLNRFISNATTAMLFSVQPSTLHTYNTGWRSWLTFTSHYNIDPYLEKVPSFWNSNSSKFSFQSLLIHAFIMYLSLESQKSPNTVHSYLTGIIHFIASHGSDTSYFHSTLVQKTKSACTLTYFTNHSVSEKATYPITIDFIISARDNLLIDNSIMNIALLTTLELAFSCLLRIGECLDTNIYTHHQIKASDVNFIISFKNQYISINCSLISNTKLSDIISVTVIIPSAKADKYGESRILSFDNKSNYIDKTRSFDLCSQLYQWSLIASPQLELPFLYYKGYSIVTTQKLNQIIRQTAELNHLDPNHFSSRSLRVGGTTTLASANASSALIAKIGGWKSLTFLDYTKITLKMCDIASSALTNPDLITMNNLHQIYNSKVIHVPNLQK